MLESSEGKNFQKIFVREKENGLKNIFLENFEEKLHIFLTNERVVEPGKSYMPLFSFNRRNRLLNFEIIDRIKIMNFAHGPSDPC